MLDRERATLNLQLGEAHKQLREARKEIRRLTDIIIQMRREGYEVPPEATDEEWDPYNMEDADKEWEVRSMRDRPEDGP